MSRNPPPDGAEIIASALRDAFVMDAPMGGQMGVVEMLQSMSSAQKWIANAICRPGVPYPTRDGGKVGDLTEAMIEIGIAMHRIADGLESIGDVSNSLDRIADAIAGRATP